MPARDFMVGLAANPLECDEQDLQWIKEAGAGWLRTDLRFDTARFLRGERQDDIFYATKQRLQEVRERGFQFTGLTPGPRRMADCGAVPGSAAYYDAYHRICAFLGEEFKGLIDYWQVANELDIWIFRDTLSLEQSVEFLKAGIRGLKSCDAPLKVGINLTLYPSRPGEVDGNTEAHEGLYLAKGIYQDSGLDLDYAGFDSYPGSWREGGPESWNEYLDGFHQLTGKPIIIQEFGYASAGELMTEEQARSGVFPCEVKRWKYAWHGGHTPETQAAFIEESFRIFAQKPFVLGATYFSWKDRKQCWQCKQPDCPMETAWGLLDRNGNRKPSYYGFQSSVRKYFGQ